MIAVAPNRSDRRLSERPSTDRCSSERRVSARRSFAGDTQFGVTPIRETLTTASGDSVTVCFSADNTGSRLVDHATGNYIQVRRGEHGSSSLARRLTCVTDGMYCAAHPARSDRMILPAK
jgi:hypothetical protein